MWKCTAPRTCARADTCRVICTRVGYRIMRRMPQLAGSLAHLPCSGSYSDFCVLVFSSLPSQLPSRASGKVAPPLRNSSISPAPIVLGTTDGKCIIGRSPCAGEKSSEAHQVSYTGAISALVPFARIWNSRSVKPRAPISKPDDRHRILITSLLYYDDDSAAIRPDAKRKPCSNSNDSSRSIERNMSG